MIFITGKFSRFLEGVLMAYKNNTWGTVCDDVFEEIDAQAACHTLGFNGLTEFQTHYDSGFTRPAVPIAMDNVGCTPSTANFVKCKYSKCPGNSCCSHQEDILLTCN